MNRLHYYVCTTLAVMVAVAFIPVPSQAGETPETDKVSVGTLSKSPAKYVGKEIRLEGVVTKVKIDDQVFVVVDNSACGGCPSKRTCGVFELPVSYKGKLPKKNKKVKVTGVLTEPEEGKYLFKALRLE